MPNYNFRHKETGEEYTEFMSISELDTYLANNPHVEQTLTTPAIVSGISTRLKPDKGFRSLLSEIKRKNPKSNINDFGGSGT